MRAWFDISNQRLFPLDFHHRSPHVVLPPRYPCPSTIIDSDATWYCLLSWSQRWLVVAGGEGRAWAQRRDMLVVVSACLRSCCIGLRQIVSRVLLLP